MKNIPSNLVPRHILISQLGSIRDCLLTIPLSVELKQLWPEAKVSWIVESEIEPLLEDHSSVDQVIRLASGWLRRPKEWRRLGATLQDQRFDLVFDPLGLTKSAMLGPLTGAKTRVGFSSPQARELSPWLYTHRVSTTHRHRLDNVRELLKPWKDILAGVGEFAMPKYGKEAASIDEYLQEQGISPSDHWFAIHPGAIWPTARWPVERFGKIAGELLEYRNLKSLVIWSGEEEQLHAKVISENSNGAARVAPKLTLAETIELLRRSRFLFCGDCESLHLASSVNTPCLSLHGPTWADEFGAYGEKHLAIQSPIANLSKRMVRRGPNTAMQAIEVEEVIYNAKRLLSRLGVQRSSAFAAA